MLTLAKKLSCFKEPVLLLLFRVEEVLSDAPEESLAIGYRFKNINNSFWVSGCGGFHLSQGLYAPERQPKGGRQGPGAPRRSSQGLSDTDQVLLLAVGISAGERDIVKVFPERVIKL